MRLRLLFLSALIGLTFTGVHLTTATEKDDELKSLQGKWTIVSAESRGKEERERVGEEWVIEGDILTIKHAKGDLKGRIHLDASKTPKALDLRAVSFKEDGATLAIYSIDGDVFKICGDKGPKPQRPTEFGTKPNTGLFLAVLKREK